MPIEAISGAITGASSLIGGLLGNSAAQKAAAQQAAAGKQAASLAGEAGQQAQGYQTGQIAAENANATPFVSAGQNATTTLNNALAPGGILTQGYGSFSAPTALDAQNNPGYQFQLQQGTSALQNSAAARGGLLSSGTAKALENYTQGLASTDYQQVYNNALQTYGTNFNTFNTNNNNLYSRLLGVSSLGANSAANLNSVTAGSTNALTNGLFQSAGMQGNDLMNAATASAGGIVGGTNALTSGISGALNGFGGAASALWPQQPSNNFSYWGANNASPIGTSGPGMQNVGSGAFGEGAGPVSYAPPMSLSDLLGAQNASNNS